MTGRFAVVAFAILLSSTWAFAWTVVGEGLGGWQTRKLSIYVNPTGCPISDTDLYGAVDAAISTWNQAFAAGIQLARVLTPATSSATALANSQASPTPVILCDTDFGSNNNTDPDFVPAATRVAAGGSNLNYAGIALNAQVGTGAQIAALDPGQLAVTLSHEVGHVLGLGHSSDPKALMYFSIEGKEQPIVTEDDVQGISFLYPRNEFTQGAFGCGGVRGEGGGPWSLGWIVAFVAICLAAGRLLKRIVPPNAIKLERLREPRE